MSDLRMEDQDALSKCYFCECQCSGDHCECAAAEEITRLTAQVEALREAVDEYLAELDAPVPDYILRRKLLGDLRKARTEYEGKK